MIQLTQSGLICGADRHALRAHFHDHHTLRLPQFIQPELMSLLFRRMECGSWVGREHGKIGREIVLDDLIALNLLHFAVSTPEFLSLIREITECEPIVRYTGRIYSMIPGADHYDSWHETCPRRVQGAAGWNERQFGTARLLGGRLPASAQRFRRAPL